MIGKTPDISAIKQLCVILKYFDKSNKVANRYFGFVDVSAVDKLTNLILK